MSNTDVVRVVIEVNRNPTFVVVNGLRIDAAPPVAELPRVIGTPTRADTGPEPAPAGHRNNQQHVFDTLGLHVNEHHYTRRAQEIGITLSVAERRYGFTPASAFNGDLLFDGVPMPLRATVPEFLQAAPWEFQPFLSGQWNCKFDGFFVGFDAVGRKLASGRRSKRRLVVDISISWPHDPHGEPAGGDDWIPAATGPRSRRPVWEADGFAICLGMDFRYTPWRWFH